MKNSFPENAGTAPENKKTQNDFPLCLLPSWLFFSEKIEVDAGTTPENLKEQVALHVDRFASIPSEQLLTGFRTSTSGYSVLCYAGTRERCREILENLPAGTLHALPAFSLWEDDNVRANPLWIWFATKSEITALKFVPDSSFPEAVNSWELVVPEDASEEEFAALILKKREEFQSEIGDNTAEQKSGIYVLGEQIFSQKTKRGEIRLERVDVGGKRVPAARTLNFSTAKNALWFADIRDEAVLFEELRERKNRAIVKNSIFVLAICALAILIAQIVLGGIRRSVELKGEIVRDQIPKVQEIQSQAKLIEEISKIQKNRLQMIRSVALINAQRPEGVGLSNFSGNGKTGILSISGSAESISLANEFEKKIRACGFFKNISFVASISSSSSNFSLQCSPIKEKIDAVDFFETEQIVSAGTAENVENDGVPEDFENLENDKIAGTESEISEDSENENFVPENSENPEGDEI